MKVYFVLGEINFLLIDLIFVIVRVCVVYEVKVIKIDEIDGISMEFVEWCFNLCSLNMEFVVRLNVELRCDIKLMNEEILNILCILRE